MSSTEAHASSLRAEDDEGIVKPTAEIHTLPKRMDSSNLSGSSNTSLDASAQNGDKAESVPDDATVDKGMENGDNSNKDVKGPETASFPAQPYEESVTKSTEQLSMSSRRTGESQFLRIETDGKHPPIPPRKNEPYLDPTPKTPLAPTSPSETPAEYINKDLPEVPAHEDPGNKNGTSADMKSEESQAEIQSIMDQFADETKSLGQEEIMSPRLELADQFRTTYNHFPPRKSSLEAVKSVDSTASERQQPRSWQSRPASIVSRDSRRSLSPPAVPPKSPPNRSGKHIEGESAENSTFPDQSLPPPAPEPEPDLPFDFHRFLEQLRHRTADPVAKYLRSFLTEFGKRQWMVHEQVKIISDFLAFITNKMAQCEVWKNVSEVEFENAKEGMEKLVMNRLYSQTFSPAIPPPPTPSRSRSRSRRKEMERFQGPGRRGQHQEDVERDEVLAQKIRIYSWIREEHLDIPPLGSNGRRFLALAQQELLKIKGYRAPRDKVICIMNCCKVIFGLLRNSKNSDTSADSFVPLLIYVVLKANPEHLVSNLQYILRFRNQEKLGGEAGYYLSSLSGAIHFIETLDRTSLTISDEEFERNVEAAVSAIAEREHASTESESAEKSLATGGKTPRSSHEETRSRSGGTLLPANAEENPAVAGILRTIQKPLTTIGRIFADDSEHQREPSASYAQQQPRQQQLSHQAGSGRSSSDDQRAREQVRLAQASEYDAQEAAARQASAEAAEARRISRAEHENVVETLTSMFPNLDRDVIDDVVRMKEGRVGLAVDACLALSAE
ncbi:hypothetical protein VTO42DRAFT_1375 [Malbranchea cinnamomea]